MYKVDEEAEEEVMQEAAAHIKMGLSSQMSPVTLKIQSGLNCQKRQ